MDYGYNTQNGRLETIESSAGTYTTYAKYHYVENSDLVDGHAIAASSSATSFFYDRTVYEDNRNLIDRVESGFNSSTDYWLTTETTRRSYYDYTNDDAGRRTARTDWYNPSGTPSTINNSFGYNEHNELETADFGSDDYDYAYDNIGNRRSSTLNSSTTAYSPDELNQYNSVGGKTYRYDADGNLETDGEKWICTWDAENRLTSIRTWHSGEGVVTGDKKYVFAYDYDGRRYKKSTFTYTGTVWGGTYDNFVWNGNRIIYQKGLSGPARSYVWGLEGKLLAEYFFPNNFVLYYGYDGNKNVSDLVRNGSYVDRYHYDAFGNSTTDNNSFYAVIANPFRFSSEYVDNETGWSAYKYRYYSPKIGRFLSRDPIEELGGLNLYGFVGNSPIQHTDMLGLQASKIPIGAEALANEGADLLGAMFGDQVLQWVWDNFGEKDIATAGPTKEQCKDIGLKRCLKSEMETKVEKELETWDLTGGGIHSLKGRELWMVNKVYECACSCNETPTVVSDEITTMGKWEWGWIWMKQRTNQTLKFSIKMYSNSSSDTLQPNETLSQFAQRYGGYYNRVDRWKASNPQIEDFDNIPAGAVINIPSTP